MKRKFDVVCSLNVIECLDEVECVKMKRVSRSMTDILGEQWGFVQQLGRCLTRSLVRGLRLTNSRAVITRANPLPPVGECQVVELQLTHERRIPEPPVQEHFFAMCQMWPAPSSQACHCLVSLCPVSHGRIPTQFLSSTLVQWRCGSFETSTDSIWTALWQRVCEEMERPAAQGWQQMLEAFALALAERDS